MTPHVAVRLPHWPVNFQAFIPVGEVALTPQQEEELHARALRWLARLNDIILKEQPR